MQIRTRPYRAEVSEREKRDAVHAMRAQIHYAPIRAVFVEDRLGLDVAMARRLAFRLHGAYCTIFRFPFLYNKIETIILYYSWEEKALKTFEFRVGTVRAY